MKLKINVPDDNIENAMTCASIRYWCDLKRSRFNIANHAGYVYEAAVDSESGAGVRHRLNIAKGLTLMAEYSPQTFAALLGNGSRVDGTVGDALIQYAAFGKLVFG